MERSEIVSGLKKGRTLVMDGLATPEERKIVLELQGKGLVSVTPIHGYLGSEYTAHEVRWIKAKK